MYIPDRHTLCPKKRPPCCWNRLKHGGVFLGHMVFFLLQALTESIKSGEIGDVKQVIVPFGTETFQLTRRKLINIKLQEPT